MLFLQLLFKDLYHLLRSRESRAFLGLAFRLGGDKRYTLRKVNFLHYSFQVPDSLSFLWQFKEIFMDEDYRFPTNTPQPLIYDCGANIGTSCAYFKKLYPQASIKAFEADPTIANLLKQNLATNRIVGVEVIDKAVWTDENGIEMGQEGADGGSIYGSGNRIRIPSVRLKTLLEAEGTIDMLKMDIEGAEVAVLNDCKNSLSKVRNIFIEYHAYLDRPQELDEVLAVLRSNGFRYFLRAGNDRRSPMVNRQYRQNTTMDVQLNIFGYQTN